MIGISKLYCGTVEPSDALRYGRDSSQLPSHLLQFSADKKPVVVWNVTRRCNLRCVHCYAHATDQADQGDSTTVQVNRSWTIWRPSACRWSFSPAASLSCAKICRSSRPTPWARGCGRSFPPTAP